MKVRGLLAILAIGIGGETGAEVRCLRPMLRERELEEIILRGTAEQQIAETRSIVQWFGQHEDEVDALTAINTPSEGERARLRTLALEMHEKLREWSALMHIADGPRQSPLLTESAERVLETYLKTVGAAPIVHFGGETIQPTALPPHLNQTLFGLYMNELRKREVPLHILNRAAGSATEGLAGFKRGKDVHLATSHRALAELRPGIIDIHEMVHFRTWAAQKNGKDVLFAGQFLPPDAAELPLDELPAYSKMIHAIVRRLSQEDVRPLEREELVRDLRSAIVQHRAHITPLVPIVPRALQIARGRQRLGFESELFAGSPGLPKTAEASIYFPLHPGDAEDQLLVLEFAPQHLKDARRRSTIRLETLQTYLSEASTALDQFDRLHGDITSQQIQNILPQIQDANRSLQDALRKAAKDYSDRTRN